ncbi:MAG TPA: MmcQ/YjbR family DNA-binding protein [Polyangiaceae bacterium]|nr:MmcQ/YjbR family DNA-binding protein [Polyangiaceae bacterium]
MAARKQKTKPAKAPKRPRTAGGSKRPSPPKASAPSTRGSRARASATTKQPKATRSSSTKSGLAAHQRALAELRAFGLALPEAHTKSPWPGHLDLAVRDKTFAYLNDELPLSISCKLPQSCHEALGLPFTTPTGYGLGKSGWVTATFAASDNPPVAFLKAWIEESYRAQAPKRLVQALTLATGERRARSKAS